ncbi:LysR family transcriptional regulator [Pigmentiphaga sp. GD03639]|uniref:LysR family transcriptional regulator n=1 Tax=Pigmentiphaga daeguensis TaxID=414049 RepID=A0ABN1CQC5_9BURK|nr:MULTISPECIES: LysR family transcriptional regulator [unclassified Pigmentiphaga]MDH2236553.1 LysR family transcriptional regulator [Pigmentiphaga sp. GD03639]OVZ61831.1 LysR family transcriptional regulator [Pigmentiphaga sp. NML030171]
MSKLDLTDLRLLQSLGQTGTVSATADELGLSQPSVSIRLGKLRRHFKDPLFVRTSAGMVPTPRAASLTSAVQGALALFDGTEGRDPDFDPATSDRVFRICMTNTGQMVVLARLLNRLAEIAPHVRLEIRDLDPDTPRRLETGDADLAMGYTTSMQAGFHQQTLFSEHYVCLVRAGHPRVKAKLTKSQFLSESHVAVMTTGTAHWLLDKAIDDAGIVRKTALWVPSFLGLEEIVARTDLLALAPIHLARILAAHGTIRYLAVPFDLPSYLVRQYWHERYHRDPGCKWLRAVAASVFQE